MHIMHIYQLCCHLSFRPFSFEDESVTSAFCFLFYLNIADIQFSRSLLFLSVTIDSGWSSLRPPVMFLEKNHRRMGSFAGENDALDAVLEVFSGKRGNFAGFFFNSKIVMCVTFYLLEEKPWHLFLGKMNFHKLWELMLGSQQLILQYFFCWELFRTNKVACVFVFFSKTSIQDDIHSTFLIAQREFVVEWKKGDPPFDLDI